VSVVLVIGNGSSSANSTKSTTETHPSGDRTLVHEDPDTGEWYDNPELTEGPLDEDSTDPLMVLQETVVETGNDETRKSRRPVERALSDLHEIKNGAEFDEVRIITETERAGQDGRTRRCPCCRRRSPRQSHGRPARRHSLRRPANGLKYLVSIDQDPRRTRR
jgi:hypothetical protein